MAIIANNKNVKKTCSCCGQELPLKEFYASRSPIFAFDGKVNMCKSCIANLSTNERGEIDMDKFKNTMRNIDKPFYYDNVQSAINQFAKEHGNIKDEDIRFYGKDIIGLYMKNANSLRQMANQTFADSEKEGHIKTHSKVLQNSSDVIVSTDLKRASKKNIDEEIVVLDEEVFEVTPELIELFGDGYSRIEYKKMSKKYKEMTETYVIQTSLHKEALLTYIRFKVKEELATARGDVQEAQKWYSAAQDAADKAKLSPRQLSKEDLQGGIVNFSDIFSAVEGAKERIKIFPEFKYAPKDAADFIIWCYINYERNLNNMPEIEYKDIYAFYDRKKQEYIEAYGDPYGIFTEDTSESNRDAIEKFITIPKEFQEV